MNLYMFVYIYIYMNINFNLFFEYVVLLLWNSSNKSFVVPIDLLQI